MRYFFLMTGIAVAALTAGGCASSAKKGDLRRQLDMMAQKFELAKKENDNLKKEVTLCRDTKRVDARQFLKGVEVFEALLADQIARGDVWLNVTDRGLVITISSERLFNSGNDSLSDEGKAFLDRIFSVVASDFPENYIFVEGHTDNQSLAVFEWKSDWEFSFARSLGVVQYLKEKGVDPLRLSASGFGQYKPRSSNDTKEGRRLNRRIEIVISPQRIGHVVES